MEILAAAGAPATGVQYTGTMLACLAHRTCLCCLGRTLDGVVVWTRHGANTVATGMSTGSLRTGMVIKMYIAGT